MAFALIPNYSFGKVEDITPEFLINHNIKFLMIDLDNTLGSYADHAPGKEVIEWADKIQKAGTQIFIVSNNKKAVRTERYAKALGVGFVRRAKKPHRGTLLRVMEFKEINPRYSALCGDQIFTDVLSANHAGIKSIIVKPIKCTNVLLSIRYFVETPFRALCRNKYNKRKL